MENAKTGKGGKSAGKKEKERRRKVRRKKEAKEALKTLARMRGLEEPVEPMLPMVSSSDEETDESSDGVSSYALDTSEARAEREEERVGLLATLERDAPKDDKLLSGLRSRELAVRSWLEWLEHTRWLLQEEDKREEMGKDLGAICHHVQTMVDSCAWALARAEKRGIRPPTRDQMISVRPRRGRHQATSPLPIPERKDRSVSPVHWPSPVLEGAAGPAAQTMVDWAESTSPGRPRTDHAVSPVRWPSPPRWGGSGSGGADRGIGGGLRSLPLSRPCWAGWRDGMDHRVRQAAARR